MGTGTTQYTRPKEGIVDRFKGYVCLENVEMAIKGILFCLDCSVSRISKMSIWIRIRTPFFIRIRI